MVVDNRVVMVGGADMMTFDYVGLEEVGEFLTNTPWLSAAVEWAWFGRRGWMIEDGEKRMGLVVDGAVVMVKFEDEMALVVVGVME